MHDITLVVPCFNEESRIDRARFLALARESPLGLLFVNDGSTDGTNAVLNELERAGDGKITHLTLAKNGGKAEAVRQGMLTAARSGAQIVGFADSDLATPPEELVRLVRALEASTAAAIIGSRIAFSGTEIERKMWRHYTGRVFATAASMILRARFYDTQCGAKVFRNTELFRAALSTPFRSRWAFDVELILRMLEGAGGVEGIEANEIVEMPLQRWVDVAGSKLNVGAMANVLLDLSIIAFDAEKRRRRARRI